MAASKKFSEAAWFDADVSTVSSNAKHSVLNVYFSSQMHIILWVTSLIVVVAFFLPFVSADYDEKVVASAYQMAMAKAPQLWNVPLLVGIWIWLMYSRKDIEKISRFWPSLFVVSVGSLVSIFYTWWKILKGVAVLHQRYHRDVHVSIGVGTWIMTAMSVIWLLLCINFIYRKYFSIKKTDFLTRSFQKMV